MPHKSLKRKNAQKKKLGGGAPLKRQKENTKKAPANFSPQKPKENKT